MADINREVKLAQNEIRKEVRKLRKSVVFPGLRATPELPMNPYLLSINAVQTDDGRLIPTVALQVAYQIKGSSNVTYWNVAL